MNIIKNIKKIYVLSLLMIYFGDALGSNHHNSESLKTALIAFGFERIPLMSDDLEKARKTLLVKAEDDDSVYTVEKVKSYYDIIKNSIDAIPFIDEDEFIRKEKSIEEAYQSLEVEYTLKTKWEDIETAYRTILRKKVTKEKKEEAMIAVSLLEKEQFLLNFFITDTRRENKSIEALPIDRKINLSRNCYALLGLNYIPSETWSNIKDAYISKMESSDITVEKQEELKEAISILKNLKDLLCLPFQNQELKEKRVLIGFISDGSFNKAEQLINSDDFQKFSNKDTLDVIKVMLHSQQMTNPISDKAKRDARNFYEYKLEYQEIYKNILHKLCKSISDNSDSIEKRDLDKIFELILLDKKFLFFGLISAKLVKDKRVLFQEKTINKSIYNPKGNVISYLDYCLKNTPKDDPYLNDRLKPYIIAIQDDLNRLSLVDCMFFDAYQEYLKGNLQDLRNLVFPISKNLYILAPKKDSQTQAMTVIANSLCKLFKKEGIKYLLFDLVEKKYQKNAADDLLIEMELLPKKSNKVEAQGSKN